MIPPGMSSTKNVLDEMVPEVPGNASYRQPAGALSAFPARLAADHLVDVDGFYPHEKSAFGQR
jgi:hypothetical protein